MESPMPVLPLANLQTVGQARAELEARLMAIHNDLQLTQNIGLLFVKREEDLRNCFEQLQELSALEGAHQHSIDSVDYGTGSDATIEQPLPDSVRERLAMLDRDFQEGQNGILGLKGLIDAQLPAIEIQPPQNDAFPRAGSNVLPSSALPTQNITKPRRHKVVVPPVPSINDPAFPVQIQQELLNQVRYWTSQAEMKEKLNQEYDTKITEMERIIDALNKQRRMREESDERQKEDQWNLELMNQELRTQNQEMQQQLSRALHENSKIQKALSVASEQLEQFKDKEERTAGQLELTKSRHEQDMMAMRKHTAGIQREKSDLMKKLEELNATVAQQQQKLVKKATIEALALAQEKERLEQGEESPVEAPILIQAPPRLPSNEEIASTPVPTVPVAEPKAVSLARETSFAHQQSIISELQSKLSQAMTTKEQLMADKEGLLTEKEELVKLLADREETIESMRLEGTMGGFDSAVPQIVGFGQVALGSDDNGTENPLQGLDREFEASRELPPLRAASPMHAGGLFAELAQAKSIMEPVKPTVEYKDQEAMTEPIENWIHTIPGLTSLLAPAPAPAPAPVPTSESASAPERLPEEVISEADVESGFATTGDTTLSVISVAQKADVERSTIATNTDIKTLVDGSTSTEDLPTQATSGVMDIENQQSKSLADNATPTEDLLLATPVTEAVVEPEVIQAKILMDSATSTDDLPKAESVPVIAKTMVDNSTSTEDFATTTIPSGDERMAPATSSQRNRPLEGIITRKSSMQVKGMAALDSPNVATPTVNSLDVVSLYPPDVPDQAQESAQVKNAEPAFANIYPEEGTEPTPRFMHSEIPLDDERRHTCDMSRSMADVPSHMVPPVPMIPKDITRPHSHVFSIVEEEPEFRVSFGSAFGDNGSANLVTGQIEPIYSSAQSIDRATIIRGHGRLSHHQQVTDDEDDKSEYNHQPQQHHHLQKQYEDSEALSPGQLVNRSSTLLMVSEHNTEYLNDNAVNNGVHINQPSNSANSATYLNQPQSLNTTMPTSPPLTYPVRTASIRSASLQPEKKTEISTGAAIISTTTRTAYTFHNSSSQVHIPQAQGQNQHPYQHITDSSGASIGRSKYRPSPSGSVSSISTDYAASHNERRMSIGSNYDGAPTPTDPTMIQIITQTMIGDYLWKYTRRPMASVISEKKHRRYFWVHPYTKTMYWSLNNPAADGLREQRAKSALIMNVYQITEENPSNNSDLPNVSLLIQTSNRNLKLTAPTRQKHDLWYQSLAYLLSRPTTPGADISTDNQTWSEVQASRGTTSDALLTIKNEKTVRKKGSFNRLQSMFGRTKENSPAVSPRSTHGNVLAGPGSTLNVGSFTSTVGSTNEINSDAGNGSGNESVVNSVIGYPGHMANSQTTVGGYGTMNGGPIMSQGSSYYHDGENGDDDEDEDVELPEHMRQFRDRKHDISAH